MQKTTKISRLKPRSKAAHKGDFGKVCIIAGSVGMSGAAALAGRAALRAGAGLVRVATPKSALPIVASIEPSFTTIPLQEDKDGRIAANAANDILNLIDENDLIPFDVTQDTEEIRGILERRAGRLFDRYPKFVGHDIGERRLAEAGRTVEDNMVEGVAALLRRFDEYTQVPLELRLPHKLFECFRTKERLALELFEKRFGIRYTFFGHVPFTSQIEDSVRRRSRA